MLHLSVKINREYSLINRQQNLIVMIGIRRTTFSILIHQTKSGNKSSNWTWAYKHNLKMNYCEEQMTQMLKGLQLLISILIFIGIRIISNWIRVISIMLSIVLLILKISRKIQWLTCQVIKFALARHLKVIII